MADLLALTRKESLLVTRFVALLRQEQEALQRGDATALPALTTDKAKLVDELNTLAVQRNQTLEGEGLATDSAGMSAWLQRNPGDKTAHKAWSDLLALARQARELHEQNNQLLTLHLRETNEALSVLQQEVRKSQLYGPDGQSSPLTGNRIIDAA